MDWRIERLDRVDSTNDVVKGRLHEPEGLVIVAKEQLGGRGRNGRTFQSVAGGLYLSLLLRPSVPLDQLAQITAWVAVAVRQGLHQACGVEAGIKWPNDLLVNGKKICGILVEQVGEALVLGIGINVSQSVEEFGPELATIATSLAVEVGRSVSLDQVEGAVLQALGEMYLQFPTEGKEKYHQIYEKLCLNRNRQVRLVSEQGERLAIATGVDETFGLVVELIDGTVEHITAGEVSVRGLLGYWDND